MRPWFGLVLVVSLAACGRDSGAPPVTSSASSASRPPSVPAPVGPVATGTAFELRATARGPYGVGVPKLFAVELTGRGGWHVNERYPIAVRVSALSDVRLPQPELRRADAAEFSTDRARFEIPFETTMVGAHSARAAVSFSMCSRESCIMEQRTVVVAFSVTAGG